MRMQPYSVLCFLESQTVPCPQCGKEYKNSNCMKSHLSQDCGKEKIYHCTICNNMYKRKYHLKEHMIRKHHQGIQWTEFLENNNIISTGLINNIVFCYVNSIKQLTVSCCLSAHLSQDCGKAKSYSCNYCESSFKRKYHLKAHMIRRHPDVYNSELNL
nr:unnamed protein product [Callosobruchus chinensis]